MIVLDPGLFVDNLEQLALGVQVLSLLHPVLCLQLVDVVLHQQRLLFVFLHSPRLFLPLLFQTLQTLLVLLVHLQITDPVLPEHVDLTLQTLVLALQLVQLIHGLFQLFPCLLDLLGVHDVLAPLSKTY